MFRSATVFHTTLLLEADKVNKLVTHLYESGVCQLKKAEAKLKKTEISLVM